MLHSQFNRHGTRVINATIYHGMQKGTLTRQMTLDLNLLKPNDIRKNYLPSQFSTTYVSLIYFC